MCVLAGELRDGMWKSEVPLDKGDAASSGEG